MVSVYLQPDRTQLVRAKLRKDGTLHVQEYREIPQSYLDIFNKLDSFQTIEEAAQELSYMFSDIKESMNIKRDGIYIVLPDYLFNYIDCFQYESDEELEQQIASATGLELDELYYSAPIVTKPAPQETWKTVYAIQRKVIDIFIEAADLQNAKLYSIEPSSLSFLRSTGKFSKEEFIFQAFDKQATFIAYSSIAGLFTMDISELAMENISNMENEAANAAIQSDIIQFESTAEQTFTFMNQGIPFVLLANPVEIRSFSSFVERAAERQKFPAYISSDIPEENQQDWFCCVGTMLQSVDFTTDKFIDEGVIDSYEQILPGNILPDNIQKNTRAYQFLQKCKRVSIAGIAILGLACIAETVGIFAMSSSTEIPPSLKTDYASAQKSMKEMDTELAVIELAGKEHQYPIEAMEALVQNKPNGLGFISLDIGGKDGAGDTWITMKVAAKDPMMIQQYATALSSSEMFKNVVVSSITSNGLSSVKTADIAMSKGEGVAP